MKKNKINIKVKLIHPNTVSMVKKKIYTKNRYSELRNKKQILKVQDCTFLKKSIRVVHQIVFFLILCRSLENKKIKCVFLLH